MCNCCSNLMALEEERGWFDEMARRLELPESVSEKAFENFILAYHALPDYDLDPQIINDPFFLAHGEVRPITLPPPPTIKGLLGASLYASFMQCSHPMLSQEILDCDEDMDIREISRGSLYLKRKLGIVVPPAHEAEVLVTIYCRRLHQLRDVGVGDSFRSGSAVPDKSNELITAVLQKDFSKELDIHDIVATCIYIAGVICGRRRTVGEVASATGLREVSIRTLYSQIVRNVDLVLVDDEWVIQSDS